MVTLENLYAADIQKIVEWMKERNDVVENNEIKSIYDRMIHDLHWIKIGKSKNNTGTRLTDTCE